MRLWLGSAILLLAGAAQAGADSAMDFDACIQDWQARATRQGYAEPVVAGVIGALKPVPRVIELDRRQPEFSETFANYLNQRVTEARVERGRELLVEHAALLRDLTERYGVPPQYLIAFWGLETNYGSYLGKMPTLDSLATLACDPRRSGYFTGELFAALDLVVDGTATPDTMRGSWAGAMGHTQFMPSAYRRYAVDGDGDGRADLWNSVPDALSSAANFLSSLGWQRELRWGREVVLPRDFSYTRVGLDQPQPLSVWREQGVLTTLGRALTDADIKASLLVPAGYHGPAFLVYDNFQVIMRWNRSEFYAIAVGHLADRINGGGQLLRPPNPNDPRLSNAQVEALQKRLIELGFLEGEVDGRLGPATRSALRAFQADRGMIADGFAGRDVMVKLGIGL
ncbi:MAG: lytic murein transglycosylase [Spongiibacteraceae bacterium]|nr:lytic murein transglycosylase [Spongiibacteraceae bacterium]